MAWDKLFPNKKEVELKDPEKKVADDKPAEKSVTEIIAESLKPVTEAIAGLQNEIVEMRKPHEKPASVEVPSVLEDENAAFAHRLTPLMAKTFEMEAKMVRDDIEREYRALGFGDLWDQHRAEINKFLDSSDLVSIDKDGKAVPLRGNSEYVRNVVDMVIGRSARKSGIRFDGKENKFFLEDATGDTPTRKPLDPEILNPKQIEAAKRFGIPVDDYRKSAKKLRPWQ
jgi:hypothetical protein